MTDRSISVNGTIVPASAASIDVMDRGFRYGDGVFETLRVYGGTVFEWEAHRERLAGSCAALSLDHGIADATLLEQVHETVSANDLTDAAVRLTISRGVQPGRLTPAESIDPTVVITANSLPRGGIEGAPRWTEPAACEIVTTRRIHDDAIPAAAKTLNYLNGILARQELEQGDEALMLDGDGYVSEGATSNVFFVTDGTLYTPSLDGPVLPGVTRRVVMQLADSLSIPTATDRYRPGTVLDADEVFLTNTTWEIRPVTAVDGQGFDPGPITHRLREAFDEYVEQTSYES